MFIKLLMIFTMFVTGMIPASGFKASGSDIRIEFTHIHEHADHDHENEDHTHSETHSHELVISSAALNFIESKNNLALAFTLSNQSYPKVQNQKLPLSHYLNSIFRPPIFA